MINIIRLYILVIAIACSSIFLAFANYSSQETIILEFYRIVNLDKSPTIEDFIKLFGSDNEAEIALTVKLKGYSNAISYSKLAHANPKKYTSMFLLCVKKEAAKLFLTGEKPVIQKLPKINKDFNKYLIKTNNKEIVFEFSQNELNIENIYLPDGESIYKFVERKCGKNNPK